MASSIVLWFLMATVCMSQTVDPNCSQNAIPCSMNDQCCSNVCFNGTCCQNAGSCTNDLDCCDYYTGAGGCNANKICGACVPENGTCTTTADCCIGITILGLTCTDNMCTPVLYYALQNTFIAYQNSLDILGANNAGTLANILTAYFGAFASSPQTVSFSITVADIAALGNITINDLIAVLKASAPVGLLPNAPRNIDNITIGHLFRAFGRLIMVAKSKPNITFGDISGLDRTLNAGLANITILDFMDIIQNFINGIASLGNLTITDAARIIDGNITLNVLASLAGIGNIANFGDLTIDKVDTTADLIAGLLNSTSGNNVCNTDSDCCSGGNCKCCRSVASGFKFCDTCPCVNDGTCRRGSDCCSGYCCYGRCCNVGD